MKDRMRTKMAAAEPWWFCLIGLERWPAEFWSALCVCVCGELIGFRVCVAEVQWGCSESSRTPWALSCWPGSARSGSESAQCEAQLIKTQRCFHFLMSVNVTGLQKTCCGPILNILFCYFLFVGSELWVCCAGFTSRVSNNWVNKSILIMTRQIISRM